MHYPITSRLRVNIERKSVEEQGLRVRTGGDRGAPTGPRRALAGPTRGPLRVPFCVVPLDSSYFPLDIFLNKISYWNRT